MDINKASPTTPIEFGLSQEPGKTDLTVYLGEDRILHPHSTAITITRGETSNENIVKGPGYGRLISPSSDFVIGSNGDLFEDWKSTEVIPSKLIEVNKNYILLDCLIDSETGECETRKFKRSFIDGKFPLRGSTIVLIKLFERPGKFVIEFEDGSHKGYERYFDIDEDVSDIGFGKYLK